MMNINIDSDGINVTGEKNKLIVTDAAKKRKRNLIKNVRNSSFSGLAIFLYILLSLLLAKKEVPSGYGSWAVFWPIIFLGFVPSGLFEAIYKHRFSLFPIWSLALFAFLFIGRYFGLWHPYWVILLSIPAYYCIFGPIDKIIQAQEKGEI